MTFIDCEVYRFTDKINNKARIKIIKKTLKQLRRLRRQELVDMYRIERFQKILDKLEE